MLWNPALSLHSLSFGFVLPKVKGWRGGPANCTASGCRRRVSCSVGATGRAGEGCRRKEACPGFPHAPGMLHVSLFHSVPSRLAPRPPRLPSQLPARTSEDQACQPDPLLPSAPSPLGGCYPINCMDTSCRPNDPPLGGSCTLFPGSPAGPPSSGFVPGEHPVAGCPTHSQVATGVLSS